MEISIAFLDKNNSHDGGLKTYALHFEGNVHPRSVNGATLTLHEQISNGRQVVEERVVPVELLNYVIAQEQTPSTIPLKGETTMNPLDYLHGDNKETIEKILALLDGLSYQKAISIVDCVHDMLKYKAFVRSEPLQIDICEIQKAVRDGLKRVMSQYPDASVQPATPDDSSSGTSPQTAFPD